jgi:hypothetical protein
MTLQNQSDRAKSPNFQHPMSIVDVYGDDAEKIFGQNWLEILKNLAERERVIEDAILSPEILASFPGVLRVSESSPAHVRRGKNLVEFRALVRVAPGNIVSSFVVNLLQNGSIVSTLTFEDQDLEHHAYMRIPWKNDSDILSFSISSMVGAVAADLTCIARFV